MLAAGSEDVRKVVMNTLNDDTRNMGASALLGIKRSASKQDLQSIMDELGGASNPDSSVKNITPEFDPSGILTPSIIGRADGNMESLASAESMSQFLGQTYPLPPPATLQMYPQNNIAGSRLFNGSPTPNTTEQLHHQTFQSEQINHIHMFGNYAPPQDLHSYHTALNPPGPLIPHTAPAEASQVSTTTASGRSKRNAAPKVPTRVSGRKRTIAKPKTTDSASAPLMGGRGKSRKQDNANAAPILKKQIVDAMNSKPQRGRKRSNLTDEERQELTRTRNRQHAKSTRERKKARLEDLTKIEEEFNELLGRLATEDERRKVVEAVISSRGQSEPPSFIAHGPSTYDMEGNEIAAPPVSFEHCFDDPDSFSFKRPGKTIRGLTNLAKGNSELLVAITNKFDEKAAKSLSVTVYGGEQGVALARDFAFGQWEMKTVTNATAHAQTIAAGFFKVIFRPGLPKIMELEFSADDVKMAIEDGNFEQLPSFPSVSSFPMNLSDANLMIHTSHSSSGILGLSNSGSSINNMTGLSSFPSNGHLGALHHNLSQQSQRSEER